MNTNEYRCASCKGVFTKIWSDKEAMEEAEFLWGKKIEKHVVVCDDCFRAFMKHRQSIDGTQHIGGKN